MLGKLVELRRHKTFFCITIRCVQSVFSLLVLIIGNLYVEGKTI